MLRFMFRNRIMSVMVPTCTAGQTLVCCLALLRLQNVSTLKPSSISKNPRNGENWNSSLWIEENQFWHFVQQRDTEVLAESKKLLFDQNNILSVKAEAKHFDPAKSLAARTHGINCVAYFCLCWIEFLKCVSCSKYDWAALEQKEGGFKVFPTEKYF